MSQILMDLVKILEDEKECYTNVLLLNNYQKDALINKDLELIMQIAERQEEFAGRIQLLETKRNHIMDKLLVFMKQKNRQVSLLNVIEFYNNNLEYSKCLSELRMDILNLIGEIKEVSSLNQKLIQQNLEGVNFSLNALNSLMFSGQNIAYDKKGKDEQLLNESSFFNIQG